MLFAPAVKGGGGRGQIDEQICFQKMLIDWIMPIPALHYVNADILLKYICSVALLSIK